MKLYIKLFLSFLIFSYFSLSAKSLDIIYPQKQQYNSWAKETYVLGNINQNAALKINNQPVKIWKNNIFCHVVPLKDGMNNIVIEEINNNSKNTKTYKIYKPFPIKNKANTNNVTQEKIKYFEDLKYSIITTDGAPVRDKFSTNGNRITHLPTDTNILLEAEYGDWYKIHTADCNENLWVHKQNVKILYSTNNRYLANANGIHFSHDKNFQKIKINFDFPVPYKLVERGNDIELTIWGVKNISNIKKNISKQKTFENIQIKTFENNNLVLLIPSKESLCGYDAEYDKNTLVFQKRKIPKISKTKPLHNIIIAIDPGHGGKELGTVGPGRIPEKEVNLAISLKLKNILEKNGAKVVITRTTDNEVEIYSRPDFAKNNNAFICLSIHSNSMVDGNPYQKHGIETYYYNEQAKNLALTIKQAMVKNMQLKDNGTKFASFVLTRPTMPISVLIEVAYMPNPEEYLKLIDENFQQLTAYSISEGLKKYLLSLPEE